MSSVEYFEPITERELVQMGLLAREVHALVLRALPGSELSFEKATLALVFYLVHVADPRWDSAQLRAQWHRLLDIALELRQHGELERLFEGMVQR